MAKKKGTFSAIKAGKTIAKRKEQRQKAMEEMFRPKRKKGKEK